MNNGWEDKPIWMQARFFMDHFKSEAKRSEWREQVCVINNVKIDWRWSEWMNECEELLCKAIMRSFYAIIMACVWCATVHHSFILILSISKTNWYWLNFKFLLFVVRFVRFFGMNRVVLSDRHLHHRNDADYWMIVWLHLPRFILFVLVFLTVIHSIASAHRPIVCASSHMPVWWFILAVQFTRFGCLVMADSIMIVNHSFIEPLDSSVSIMS
jgi:hypothetical protein